VETDGLFRSGLFLMTGALIEGNRSDRWILAALAGAFVLSPLFGRRTIAQAADT
jgi:hypothetical protein